MQILYELIRRMGLFVFFVILEILSVFLITSESNYHKNAIGVQLTHINGVFSQQVSDLKSYFHLPEENKKLIAENASLKNKLQQYQKEIITDSVRIVEDSISHQKYEYLTAQIIDFSLNKRDNYFLINKGTKSGVHEGMAVISPNGIVGIVLNATPNFADVLSVIHSKSHIKARVKGMEYFGILEWNGEDYRALQLKEIPKYLGVKKGDTVLTAGASAAFPKDIPVGYVYDLEANDITGDLDINVRMFDDLAKVNNVYVVKNLDELEIKEVKSVEDAISR